MRQAIEIDEFPIHDLPVVAYALCCHLVIFVAIQQQYALLAIIHALGKRMDGKPAHGITASTANANVSGLRIIQ